MSPAQYSPAFSDNVEVLNQESAIHFLRADLEQRGRVLLYLYLAKKQFFDSLFAAHLRHSQLWVLADHRQRPLAAELAAHYRYLSAWSWSSNRTMHDKTIILPDLCVVYLTTANLTAGAWSMSQNSIVRVRSTKLCDTMVADFIETIAHARPVLPCFQPKH